MGRILLDAVSETILNFVFFILKFAAWGIQWTAALVVFLVVMAGAGYYVFMETLDGGEPVQVPNIMNLPLDEAQNRVAEQGLEMGRPNNVWHETIPKYHIISQRPAPGRVVRTGRKVYPTVSMGRDFLTAPALEKGTLDEARSQLDSSQFRLGSVARIRHKSPRNTVLSQYPPPGAPLEKLGDLHLLVSEGDARYEDYMPDLREKPVSEVAAIMAPYKVVLVPKYVDIPDAREGVVLNQDPQPATLITEGQTVTFEVKLSKDEEFQKGVVRHQMAIDFYDKEVRVDRIDNFGNRQVIKSYPPAFDEQSRASRVIGGTLAISVTYVKNCTVEIYVDNNIIAAYSLKNGEEPVKSSVP
ncbi:MAG: PASTA domain-containing protein [Candidatus Hydrogenedentes bacterium]|nr:PASTA domain-containing protein [Candidatus Hydrogenedentota bacterium]